MMINEGVPLKVEFKGKKVIYNCEYCGESKEAYLSNFKKSLYHFCSKKCNMVYMNLKLNPQRMTEEVKEKLRAAKLRKGVKNNSYSKMYGVHEHRLVAEKMLGRKLKKGEVVHHINMDKNDNRPENLIVFNSQADHLAWHRKNDDRYNRSVKKEVMPND